MQLSLNFDKEKISWYLARENISYTNFTNKLFFQVIASPA